MEVDDTDFFRKCPSLPRLGTILCCFLLLGVDAPRSVYVEYIYVVATLVSSRRRVDFFLSHDQNLSNARIAYIAKKHCFVHVLLREITVLCLLASFT